MQRPRVKICCLSNATEVTIAVDEGADLLGFVAPPLGGLGVIGESHIAELIAMVPPRCTAVLLTGFTGLDELVAQIERCRPDAIQLVRGTTSELRRKLRTSFPELRLLQVVHVQGAQSIPVALSAQDESHALVLDSAVLGGPVEQLGATGATHDWSVSARIVDAVQLPVYLAGGLSASNVGEARATVGPFGLDLCSSVRTDGVLDAQKVRAFLAAAKG